MCSNLLKKSTKWNEKSEVLTFANIWTFALYNLPLIYQLVSVKELFRIQIQKGSKVFFWNQVKSRMEACYSELILLSNVKTLQKLYFIIVRWVMEILTRGYKISFIFIKK